MLYTTTLADKPRTQPKSCRNNWFFSSAAKLEKKIVWNYPRCYFAVFLVPVELRVRTFCFSFTQQLGHQVFQPACGWPGLNPPSIPLPLWKKGSCHHLTTYLEGGCSCFCGLFHHSGEEKTRCPPTTARDVSHPADDWVIILLALECFAWSKAEQPGELSAAGHQTHTSWDVPLGAEELLQIPNTESPFPKWKYGLVWGWSQQWMRAEKHKIRENTYWDFSGMLSHTPAMAKHNLSFI